MNTKAFLLIVSGFWLGVLIQDSMYFFQFADLPNEGDLMIAGLMVVVNFLLLIVLKVYNQKKNLQEELGLPDEEELSLEAEYSCNLCGDPVKKGDRVLHNGKVYCTREHVEEDNE